MGKPKFSRKKFDTPSHPWQEDRIKSENEFIKKYGLKNKREIWKAQTRLGKYRTQARELLAKVGTDDVQSKKESEQLLTHLNRMNILPANSTLDDVLALETESILTRRLQTQTYLKGLASTPEQARQLITHGHIAIGENRVTIPGYLVTKKEEGDISYTSDSPLNDTMHPARPRAEYKGIPIKREGKDKEQKPKEEKQIPKKSESKSEERPSSQTPEKKDESEPSQEKDESKETVKQEQKESTDEKDKAKEEPTKPEQSEKAESQEKATEKAPEQESKEEPKKDDDKTSEKTPKEGKKPEEKGGN